jgi:hypothetical protein
MKINYSVEEPSNKTQMEMSRGACYANCCADQNVNTGSAGCTGY